VGLTGAAADFLPEWPLEREVSALAQGRLCRGERRSRCRAENGGFADWACGECQEFVRPEAISPWTWHLVFLHRLKEAGYPFCANDLSVDTWLLLGVVKRAFAAGRGERSGQRLYQRRGG
jgi:hypothetical protein